LLPNSDEQLLCYLVSQLVTLVHDLDDFVLDLLVADSLAEKEQALRHLLFELQLERVLFGFAVSLDGYSPLLYERFVENAS